MKHLYLPLLMLLTVTIGTAQVRQLGTSNLTGEATIDLAANKLSNVNVSGDKGQLTDLDMELRNGELIIEYKLASIANKEYYEVAAPVILLNGEPLALMPEQIKGEQGTLQEGGSKTMTLTNLLDQFINLQGDLAVTLSVTHFGELDLLGVDCNEPMPTFSGKQRIPYFVAAGVGAAAIGVGQLFKDKSGDIYEEQYLLATTREEADPLYEEANNNHHLYLISTYAGAAILVADAVLFVIRDSRTRKRAELYRQFCNQNSLSVKPMIEMPSRLKPEGQTGLKLTFSF